MSTTFQPRRGDHWSIRLKVQRPTRTGSRVALALGAVQAVLLYLTASTGATSGALYGCPSACGTAAQPTIPFPATILAAAVLLLPAVVGGLCQTWRTAVTAAAAPWLLAVVLHAGALLVPAFTFAAAPPTATPGVAGTVTHFAAPFWLDWPHLAWLFFSLALFAGLGVLGWLGRQALSEV
jgi:hypothetical protein